MDDGGVILEKLEGFLNDLGVSENIKLDVKVLFDHGHDVDYFFDNILSLNKTWSEMIVEMQNYKLLQQESMSVEEFKETYNNSEIAAINKLFRYYMSKDEWTDLKEIMKNKCMAQTDLYHMQINNLQKNDITNAWQLVL